MNEPISIGLGEYKISRSPGDVLVAYGLGSCLGIGMIDPVKRVSGLLHAVLPERNGGGDLNPAKFVDSGIETLVQAMLQAGAERRNLVVRMAGGANMLLTAALSNTFDIGTRNIEAAHLTLARLNLRLRAEQVGGNNGRTVRLYVDNGRMTVRVIGGKEEDL